MRKATWVLIIAKAPDGGAATFINSLLKIGTYNWYVISIEKPRFSHINSSNFKFLRKFKYKNSYSFLSANFFQIFKDLIQLYKETKAINPSAIIAIDLYPNLIVTLLKKIYLIKQPLILVNQASLKDMTESKSSFIFKNLIFFLIRVLYRSADYIISTSKYVSNDMVDFFKLPKGKVTTIYNGVEVPKSQLRKKVKIKKTILMAAKFIEPKDHETLLKAFVIVLKTFPNYKLELLGDGPKRPKIELLAKKLGISKNVDFLGWKKNVYPHIAKCKIFVLSTKNEGFGYVLVEAMAFGKPVIATDAPWGPREILEYGKFGTIIRVGDELKLSAEINSLIRNGKKFRYFSHQSLKRAKIFTASRFREKYTKVLEGLN